MTEENKYPFKEGDDYWTIENGKPIWSCWDDVSEELYDKNPNQRYFSSKKEVNEFIENSKNMIRTEILCPECMKKKLLREKEGEKDLRCDECGTEFTETATNTVVYK